MVAFEFFAGEDRDANVSKFIFLTILIWIPPVCQTLWLALLKFTHPIIEDVDIDEKETRSIHKALRCFNRVLRSCFGVERLKKGTGKYKWEETKKKYEELALMLKEEFKETDWTNIKNWIPMEKVNFMQYQEDDQKMATKGERADGRATLMYDCKEEFEDIINKVDKTEEKKHVKSTNMMKVINHHITIMNTIDLMKQINFGMKISPKTDPNRKGSMEWRGVIDEVTKLEPGLKFPDALRYSQIRKLSKDIDKKWDHGKKGTELDPHSLIIDPWGPLEKNAKGYINAFVLDMWIFYFQLYFFTVIIEVLFS